MKLNTIKKANVKNKTVLVRVDYNVSTDENGNATGLNRITQTLPTINYLKKRGAKIILMSHFGRPEGKKDKKYSFNNILSTLKNTIDEEIEIIEDLNVNNPRQISILENTRFHPGETLNDKKLARLLSKLADVFVNDAFGSSHRAHVSTVGIAEYLPSYAGLLLDKEVTLINKALENNAGKLCVIIGGAKTPEKIGVIDNLLNRANSILLGGAVANTFLSTWGHSTGTSMVDYEMIEMARQTIWKATQSNASLLMPEDVIISNSDRSREPKTISYKEIPGHLAVYDIGPKTRKKYSNKILESDYAIWNGPIGLFEDARFAKGTSGILNAMLRSKGTTIIGGGDTLTAVSNNKALKNISHISTGGGALLEFLEKGTLPGIEIVKNGS